MYVNTLNMLKKDGVFDLKVVKKDTICVRLSVTWCVLSWEFPFSTLGR